MHGILNHFGDDWLFCREESASYPKSLWFSLREEKQRISYFLHMQICSSSVTESLYLSAAVAEVSHSGEQILPSSSLVSTNCLISLICSNIACLSVFLQADFPAHRWPVWVYFSFIFNIGALQASD